MMGQVLNVVIVLLAISLTALSLTFAWVVAQTITLPEFKPETPEVQDETSSQMEPEDEPEPPRPTDFAMKVQLEPHENEFLEGYYQVSNFAIATSNSSELCPTGNCEFDLDGGEMTDEISPGERQLSGKGLILGVQQKYST